MAGVFHVGGFKQIILISRLNFLKNPLIQRGINVAAHYVFGPRRFGIRVPIPMQNYDVLKAFFARNKKTLGQTRANGSRTKKVLRRGISSLRSSRTKTTPGQVDVRTIDSTEIMDIVTDPEAAYTPWFYTGVCFERAFYAETATVGTSSTDTKTHAWYPALRLHS